MISKPRGTRDFTPEEMRKRRWLEMKMRHVFEKYGYEEISTPTLEHLDLFTLKSGEGIIEETYAFEDKAGDDYWICNVCGYKEDRVYGII